MIRPPVSSAPGLPKTPKEARGRTWVHSGKLGSTRVFLTNRSSKAPKRRGGQHPPPAGTRSPGASSTLPFVERGRDVAAGRGFAGHYGHGGHPGAGGTGGSPEDSGGPEAAAAGVDDADLTDREDTWSCCGRTVEAAGRGCGPVEPSPKVGLWVMTTITSRWDKNKIDANDQIDAKYAIVAKSCRNGVVSIM